MSLRLSLSATGHLVVELPGPGASVKHIQLIFCDDWTEDLRDEALQTNHNTLMEIIGWLRAQNRGGPIQPWLDASKPVPPVTRLEARGKARTPIDPLTEAQRNKLYNRGPATVKSLEELFAEDPEA